jgi:hypothetical protein
MIWYAQKQILLKQFYVQMSNSRFFKAYFLKKSATSYILYIQYVTLHIPWRDSISRPIAPASLTVTTLLDHAVMGTNCFLNFLAAEAGEKWQLRRGWWLNPCRFPRSHLSSKQNRLPLTREKWWEKVIASLYETQHVHLLQWLLQDAPNRDLVPNLPKKLKILVYKYF